MAKSPYVHEKLPDDDVLRDGEKRTVPMMMMRDEVILLASPTAQACTGRARGSRSTRPRVRVSSKGQLPFLITDIADVLEGRLMGSVVHQDV
jgi:hypothetical protein